MVPFGTKAKQIKLHSQKTNLSSSNKSNILLMRQSTLKNTFIRLLLSQPIPSQHMEFRLLILRIRRTFMISFMLLLWPKMRFLRLHYHYFEYKKSLKKPKSNIFAVKIRKTKNSIVIYILIF